VMNLLWLLLPVAAASGWVIARRDRQHHAAAHVASMAPEYFRGLNYLLNEQPDKAIEVFIKMVEVDRDTVETHLTLGNLYRRRGEVDRAIRIHQNLIARTTLSRGQRTHALLELGLDYMRAGLLDRAEGLFLELLDLREYVVPALRQLMDIYQQEKDWESAIRAAHQLEQVSHASQASAIAHYYCELAAWAAKKGDQESVSRRLDEALACDPRSVRASLMRAELASARGEWHAAIEAYQRVEYQDPGYLSETIAPMLACYGRLGDAAAMVPYLERILATYGGVAPLLALTELLREQRGDHAAAQFIAEGLNRSPSLRGLHQLIVLNVTNSGGELRDSLLVLKAVVERLLPERGLYRCERCGFEAMALYWQCPGCKSWSALRPAQVQVHGIETGAQPAARPAYAVHQRRAVDFDKLDLTPLP
jgi:lipopolysaccharide biosynthesis regulator YciM